MRCPVKPLRRGEGPNCPAAWWPSARTTLIWKYRASSPAPDSDAISPVVAVRKHIGREALQGDVGKPTVADEVRAVLD
jgi:hypothetical protein